MFQEDFAGIFHCCIASLRINRSEKVRQWYRHCCDNCKPPYAACKILAEQKKKTFAECVRNALECSDTCMTIAMDKVCRVVHTPLSVPLLPLRFIYSLSFFYIPIISFPFPSCPFLFFVCLSSSLSPPLQSSNPRHFYALPRKSTKT